ncbi:hypothetical protein BH11BAC7_BH11BAC7_06900 [soil metagenome]
MHLQFQVTGFVFMLLAIFHFWFPKRFEWKKECENMSLLNRQMMYVHTFFLALTVFLMGVLCLTCADELIGSPLGRKVTLGFGIFWLARLYVQFFVYSPDLWKGKKFETRIHILFSLLWVYFSFLFFYASIIREIMVVK